jgi:hypothetical protein
LKFDWLRKVNNAHRTPDAAVMAVFWYGFGVRTRFAGLPEFKNETKVEADVVNT